MRLFICIKRLLLTKQQIRTVAHFGRLLYN